MTLLDSAAIGWNPDASDRMLLAGDESALPAIEMILATLPARSRGQVFVEVQSEGASVVRWITDESNAAARRLYDSMATATPWVTYDIRL
jgi:NADPH-dependent ferric siderophore reductase